MPWALKETASIKHAGNGSPPASQTRAFARIAGETQRAAAPTCRQTACVTTAEYPAQTTAAMGALPPGGKNTMCPLTLMTRERPDASSRHFGALLWPKALRAQAYLRYPRGQSCPDQRSHPVQIAGKSFPMTATPAATGRERSSASGRAPAVIHAWSAKSRLSPNPSLRPILFYD